MRQAAEPSDHYSEAQNVGYLDILPKPKGEFLPLLQAGSLQADNPLRIPRCCYGRGRRGPRSIFQRPAESHSAFFGNDLHDRLMQPLAQTERVLDTFELSPRIAVVLS